MCWITGSGSSTVLDLSKAGQAVYYYYYYLYMCDMCGICICGMCGVSGDIAITTAAGSWSGVDRTARLHVGCPSSVCAGLSRGHNDTRGSRNGLLVRPNLERPTRSLALCKLEDVVGVYRLRAGGWLSA